MPAYNTFTVGASAGGVEAVNRLISALPADFPGAVLVVVHTSVEGPGRLWRLLGRNASLPVVTPSNGMPLKRGFVYVAPPNRHMTIADGVIRLDRGPMENRNRPAIDPLFRTAASARNSGVVGVVLTGYLDDGTAGLISIKRAGGLAIVQDPEDAAVPSMPRSALEHVAVDYCLPLAEIAPTLDRLARGIGPAGHGLRKQPKPKEVKTMAVQDEREKGKPSQYTCPACSGTLWELDEEGLLRFRCRVGHAYSADSMLDDQTDAIERALWVALRVLEENVDFATRLAARARKAKHARAVRAYEERARTARANAAVLRSLLVNGGRRAPAEQRQSEPATQ